MTRSNLHEWGILPQVVSIWWRLPGHRLSFSTGNASISDHQQNSLRQKQLKRKPQRNNPRATILKDNVSSFGAVLFSFFSPPLLMTGTFAFNYPCRNLGHWSFPFCPLFRNPPFYANFHPVVIFEQPKDQNLPFLLTSSPVSRGLDVWNNNPMGNRWCYSVILCHDSDSASWCPSACSCLGQRRSQGVPCSRLEPSFWAKQSWIQLRLPHTLVVPRLVSLVCLTLFPHWPKTVNKISLAGIL